jgi:hypothetical protein
MIDATKFTPYILCKLSCSGPGGLEVKGCGVILSLSRRRGGAIGLPQDRWLVFSGGAKCYNL